MSSTWPTALLIAISVAISVYALVKWARHLFRELAAPFGLPLRGIMDPTEFAKRLVAFVGLYLAAGVVCVTAGGTLAPLLSLSRNETSEWLALPVVLGIGLAAAATVRIVAVTRTVDPVNDLSLLAVPLAVALVLPALLLSGVVNHAFDTLKLYTPQGEPRDFVARGMFILVFMVVGTVCVELALFLGPRVSRGLRRVPHSLARERFGLCEECEQVLSRPEVTQMYVDALSDSSASPPVTGQTCGHPRRVKEILWVTQTATPLIANKLAEVVAEAAARAQEDREPVPTIARVICRPDSESALRATFAQVSHCIDVRPAHRMGAEHFMVLNADLLVLAGPLPPELRVERQAVQTANQAIATNSPTLVGHYRSVFWSWWDALVMFPHTHRPPRTGPTRRLLG